MEYYWELRSKNAQNIKILMYPLQQQATIDITRHAPSIFGILHHMCMGVVLHTNPVRGELHIQCNANREVATLAARLE